VESQLHLSTETINQIAEDLEAEKERISEFFGYLKG